MVVVVDGNERSAGSMGGGRSGRRRSSAAMDFNSLGKEQAVTWQEERERERGAAMAAMEALLDDDYDEDEDEEDDEDDDDEEEEGEEEDYVVMDNVIEIATAGKGRRTTGSRRWRREEKRQQPQLHQKKKQKQKKKKKKKTKTKTKKKTKTKIVLDLVRLQVDSWHGPLLNARVFPDLLQESGKWCQFMLPLVRKRLWRSSSSSSSSSSLHRDERGRPPLPHPCPSIPTPSVRYVLSSSARLLAYLLSNWFRRFVREIDDLFEDDIINGRPIKLMDADDGQRQRQDEAIDSRRPPELCPALPSSSSLSAITIMAFGITGLIHRDESDWVRRMASSALLRLMHHDLGKLIANVKEVVEFHSRMGLLHLSGSEAIAELRELKDTLRQNGLPL